LQVESNLLGALHFDTQVAWAYSWADKFVNYVNRTAPSAKSSSCYPPGSDRCAPQAGQFNALFQTFLAGEGVTAADQFEFDTLGQIKSLYIPFLMKDLASTNDFIAAIEATRAITDAAGIPCFPAGFPYDFYEQYLDVKSSLIKDLGYTAIGVFLAIAFFLVHPVAVLITGAIITMIVVETYGLLHFMDVKINGVCVVNMVMAVGVSVEFTCYIIRAFMIAKGTRRERAKLSLISMFMPTFNGALATFVGVIVMAFATFPYFKIYFFNMYVLIIFIGLGNGVLLLPVILSLMGPPSVEGLVGRSLDDKQTPASAGGSLAGPLTPVP